MSARSRRSFLKASLAGLSAAGIEPARRAMAQSPASSQDRVAGANRRIRVALIGCGGMGTGDLRDMLKSGAQCAWPYVTWTTRRAPRCASSSPAISTRRPIW